MSDNVVSYGRIAAEHRTYLLIDDIETHHTEAVELLFPCSRAHGVEGAAGHRGEHCAQRVGQLCARVLVMAQVLQHLGTVPKLSKKGCYCLPI